MSSKCKALTELANKVSTNDSSSNVLWIQLIRTKRHNGFIVDLSNKYTTQLWGENVIYTRVLMLGQVHVLSW